MDRSNPGGDRPGSEGVDEEDTPLQEAVGGVVVALVLLVAFGLLAVDYPYFWVAFPVGFGGVLPAAVALARYYERRRAEDAEGTADPEADALEILRDRYARDEIDEAEFERRVDALLRTESVEDARADAARRAAERERATDQGTDVERGGCSGRERDAE
ncbi:SHOCT domain-containing protein [Halorarum halophilum]|uniref:SHOCT domain-containing protein n=1 Tax=Halorarum halophilum TaxID=2743090 RepID=A0A7D5GMQ6_9EURY|nr:SHOCT domain-containing protein [Halobaculum halophilum]QLG28744.1 SHOCT domain-containing protein [Halobaculum halophilum]